MIRPFGGPAIAVTYTTLIRGRVEYVVRFSQVSQYKMKVKAILNKFIEVTLEYIYHV
jgi:hypothetical protein